MFLKYYWILEKFFIVSFFKILNAFSIDFQIFINF